MEDWVIYEIMGHKVGVCMERRYPLRVWDQTIPLLGIHRRDSVEGVHYRRVDTHHGTLAEAMRVERQWQARLGYAPDGPSSDVARAKISASAQARAAETGRNLTEGRARAYRTSAAFREALRRPRIGRPCLFRGEPYHSLIAAAKAVGLSNAAMHKRLRSGHWDAPVVISRERYWGIMSCAALRSLLRA